MKAKDKKIFIALLLILLFGIGISFSSSNEGDNTEFPLALSSYENETGDGILQILQGRIEKNPFNLVGTLIFFVAISHAFLSSKFLRYAHQIDSHKHPMKSGLFHYLGEIEVVFGLWSIALGLAITYFYKWETFVEYVGGLEYTEPVFIVVIMTVASSRPVLKFVELILWKIVKLMGGKLESWWLVILTIGPILGSFITEPAAMILSCHLLADKFFDLKPDKKIKYATLALLFVNVSVGGTLTNFAAPPVLMVSEVWEWSTVFLFSNIGWKAVLGIIVNNLIVFWLFKSEFKKLEEVYKRDRFKKYIQRRFIDKAVISEQIDALEWKVDKNLGYTEKLNQTSDQLKTHIEREAKRFLTEREQMEYDIDELLSQRFEIIKLNELKRTIPGLLPEEIRPFYHDPEWDSRDDKVPMWIMITHLVFLLWVVLNAHETVLFIGGFLFFLAFIQVTAMHQSRTNLKPALMVAFFLAGLVIHSGLQGWWIEPVISNLSSGWLNMTAILLTAFNDNAAITYLSSLVPNLSDSMKYAVVTGAVTGGGLTLVANAPNPIGQSILKKYFRTGIEPLELFKSAIIPTLVMGALFFLL